MELKPIAQKFSNAVSKYRYVLLVILIGFVLVIFPGRSQSLEKEVQQNIPKSQEKLSVEESLAQLLRRIDGAGEVAVFLTVQSGEEYIYQTDQTNNTDNNSTSNQHNTVTVTDTEHNQTGLIKKTLAPIYRGAVIVCQGANNPTVRLSIVEAVSNTTGLSTDRISVLKMK